MRESDLEVPRNLIRKALDERAHTFSMQFDPTQTDPSNGAFALELQSVVCIPLVRVQMGTDAPDRVTPGDTVGVLYMDSFRRNSTLLTAFSGVSGLPECLKPDGCVVPVSAGHHGKWAAIITISSD